MKHVILIILITLSASIKAQVVINEIQAHNASTIADDAGDYDDWIELYNSGDESIEIGGMVLKDRVDTWRIPVGEPGTLLPPGGFFLLWADDEESEGVFHTNFRLSASNGEFLGLYESDSTTVIDTLTFPPMDHDQSYIRCNQMWLITNTSTPLGDNGCTSSTKDNLSNKIYITSIPRTGEIYIKIPAYMKGYSECYVFDVTGIKRYYHKSDRTSYTFNIGNLPAGIYFISLTKGKETWTEKILLTHK